MDPIIKLGDSGQAPVLDYRVPDATTYSGRHYLEIAVAPEKFVTQMSVDNNGTIKEVKHTFKNGVYDTANYREIKNSNATPRYVLRSLTSPDAGINNDTGTTTTTNAEGDTVVHSGGGYTSNSNLGEMDDPPEINVLYPKRMHKIEAGKPVTVRGKITGGPVISLDVRLGSITTAATISGSNFTCQITPAQPGTVTLKVTASYRIQDANGLNRNNERVVSYPITILPAATSGGSQPLELILIAPQLPLVIGDANAARGAAPATVEFSGKVNGSNNIQSVKIILNGDEASAAIAEPASGNSNLSTWRKTVGFSGAGVVTIRIVATDQNGAKAELTGTVKVTPAAPRQWLSSRLFIAERLQLNNFLGRYGAGRVVKTMSLLPGETLEMSIRTYLRSQDLEKASSSFVERNDSKQIDDLATTLANEQSNKDAHSDTLAASAKLEGEQSWGTGRVKAEANISGSSNASREEFAKSLSNASNRKVSESSAMRDIKITAEHERREESGEESSITRKIQNINVGRTLNFVFRQMNQEFISVLSLVDVRLVWVSTYQMLQNNPNEPDIQREIREASIIEMDSLLEEALVPEAQEEVKAAILEVLQNIVDHKGELKSLIEEKTFSRPDNVTLKPGEKRSVSYWRVNTTLKDHWENGTTSSPDVPGIVLSGTTHILRTDGIVVDAVLGGGEAIDQYSKGLQEAAVKEREMKNLAAGAEARRIVLGNKAVESHDKDAVELLEKLKPVIGTPVEQ